MAVLIKLDKKKQTKSMLDGVDVTVCYVDQETADESGFRPGWYEWNEKDPIAEYIRLEQTSIIRVARAGNPNHRRYIRQQAQANRKKLRKGSLSQDVQDRIEIRGVAKTILLDWAGFKQPNPDDPDGDPVDFPYNEENAFLLLSNDDGFLNLVSDIAQDDEYYEDENETIKNLKPA